MRALLILVGLAALVVVALLSLGLLKLNTTPGSLPSVSVQGGAAPTVKADMATLSIGTENKTVDVPTVGTTQKTIAVPSIKLDRPEGNSTAQ